MAPRRASALFCTGLLGAGLGLWVLASGGSAAPSAAIELSSSAELHQGPTKAKPASLPVLGEVDQPSAGSPSPRRIAKMPARTAADLDEAVEVSLALASAALDGHWSGRAAWDQLTGSLAASLGPAAGARLERALTHPERSWAERLVAADLLTRLEAAPLEATSLVALRAALRPDFGGPAPVDATPPSPAAIAIHRRALVALGTARDVSGVFGTLLAPRSPGPESSAEIAWILSAAPGDGLLSALGQELSGPRAEPALLTIAAWCDAADAHALGVDAEAALQVALDSTDARPGSGLGPRLQQARTALDRLRVASETPRPVHDLERGRPDFDGAAPGTR